MPTYLLTQHSTTSCLSAKYFCKCLYSIESQTKRSKDCGAGTTTHQYRTTCDESTSINFHGDNNMVEVAICILGVFGLRF